MKSRPYRWWGILIAALVLMPFQPRTVEAQPNLQSGGRTIYMPLVFVKTGQLAVPPADEAASRIQVPDGFAIRIFAQNLGRPRLISFGPDGWLYAPLIGAGEVARLPDRNHDGLADGAEVVASGLSSPNNVAWWNGWMYVGENGKIERFKDTDGNGSFETRELVTDNIPGPGGHATRTVHFGPDDKMYVSVGSSSNNNPESDPRRAAILRFNPDGSIPADNPFANDADPQKRPVWAWGLRNSVDFLWTPGGQMWADHNGSDSLGDNKPPEEIIIPVQAGRSHGWPYCYTPVLGLNVPQQPEVRDTRVPLPGGFTCDQAVPALFTAPAHSAPLGMSLGSAGNFPDAYQDDLYVAFHGSWNTSDPADYRDCKVERVLIENGAVTGSETFANGWRAPGKTVRRCRHLGPSGWRSLWPRRGHVYLR